MEPFVESLVHTEQVAHAHTFVQLMDPAITVAQIREGISAFLHHLCRCATPSHITRERLWFRCNELAHLYHWKKHKRLALLNLNKRQI